MSTSNIPVFHGKHDIPNFMISGRYKDIPNPVLLAKRDIPSFMICGIVKDILHPTIYGRVKDIPKDIPKPHVD